MTPSDQGQTLEFKKIGESTWPVEMRGGTMRSIRRARDLRKAALVSLVAMAAVCPPVVPSAQAVTGYAPANAAAYADKWAKNANTGTYIAYSDDCTNFVSQALKAGGYKQVGSFSASGWPDTSTAHWWVYLPSAPSPIQYNSNTWSVATELRNFLLHTGKPPIKPVGSVPGSTTRQLSGIKQGDLLWYDWNNTGVSHVTIQVGNGTDPDKGYVGNYIDEHTSNRYHAFWSLYPYNSQWKTTKIYLYTFQ
ncbi:MAG TPA: amidase domain-containing protein [Mycobacteriales bacterium]|nr:amidase domain-containing protein [Mycobacteriales bacterium]